MEVQIANPIYDVVFKYMMEDNAVAKLLVSSIIKEEVISLEPKPQEYTTEINTLFDDKSSLTVYRLDFSAKIKTPEGHKLIIIEMQKASVPADVKRFRTYLGKQYSDPGNSIILEDGRTEPLQIYSIYFLGDDLKICDTPVLSIFPIVQDVATGEIIEERSRFIDLLNHRGWVVQISCLKKRRRNELELLLSVFDQTNRTDDHHILNVNEDEFPEKYRLLIRRLKMAASNKEVKKQMQDEDEVWSYLQDVERGALYQGEIKGRAEGRAEGEAERTQLKDQNTQLEADLKAKDDQLKESQAGIRKIICNLAASGMDMNQIAQCTNLPIEEVRRLMNK